MPSERMADERIAELEDDLRAQPIPARGTTEWMNRKEAQRHAR